MGLKNTSANVVESFFIQHSLPRFPVGPTIYDSNLSFRAQHFFCISMKDEFAGQDSQTSLIPPSELKDTNFFKILYNYAAIMNVNFFRMPNDRISANFQSVFNYLADLKDQHRTKNLSSFLIESTATNGEPISVHVTAKSPDNHIDIFDDVTSLLSIHHDDYKLDGPRRKTGNHASEKTAMLMITQSHTDPATLGINQKVLIDRDNHFATVHILNSAYVNLPVEGSAVPHHQPSMYRDHSKWSVNVIYGMEGSFPATLCFYDLNRSTKQAHRGGGAFCLNSSYTGSSRGSVNMWNMFMSLGPKPTDMARFINAPVDHILGLIDTSNTQSSHLAMNASAQCSDKSPSNPLSSAQSSSTVTDEDRSVKMLFTDEQSSYEQDLDSISKSLEYEDVLSSSCLADDDEEWLSAQSTPVHEFTKGDSFEIEYDDIPSDIEMSYLKFSNDEVKESGKHILLIFHRHASRTHSERFDVIPCPFRYSKEGRIVEVGDKVPSLIGLKINDYFSQYGPEKLNKHLKEKFQLAIYSTKTSKSPIKRYNNSTEFGTHVKVVRSKRGIENTQDANYNEILLDNNGNGMQSIDHGRKVHSANDEMQNSDDEISNSNSENIIQNSHEEPSNIDISDPVRLFTWENLISPKKART